MSKKNYISSSQNMQNILYGKENNENKYMTTN